MSTLVIVPARGGSKGLPNKNLLEVGGKSLVARAVDVARTATGVDDVLVSSDDLDVLAAGAAAGARTVRRPDRLARDATPTIDVIQHHLAEEAQVRRLVLLQPTSPLRKAVDVERCLQALDAGAVTAATVTPAHPAEWLFRSAPDGALVPIFGWPLPARRQDAAPVVTLNGAVYAAEAEYLRRGGALVGPGTVGVVMPSERSVDIDSPLDLAFARLVHETSL